jgi:transposase
MESIGVDVSNWSLSCAWRGLEREFPNDEEGVREALEWAKGAQVWCMEATGRHHRGLADSVCASGLRRLVVNPGRARKYLGFVNPRGKTDRLDAAALRRLAECEGGSLRAYSPVPARGAAARDTLVRRRSLVEARVSLEQTAAEAGDPGGHMADAAAALRRAQACLDKELAAALSGLAGYERLLTVPGVGPLTAAALACALERGEFAGPDALVAFLGLDPRPDDSGRHRGRRRLSHQGDAQARTFLFTAARAGSRLRPWKPYYQSQLAKGLSSTEATVVLARKLARVCWKVYRQEGPFQDKTVLDT